MKRAGTQNQAQLIADELARATAAKKCHSCGCFQGALAQLAEALPSLSTSDHARLEPVLDSGSDKVAPQKYDCLGCEVCWPANALNIALEAFPELVAGDTCPADTPTPQRSWPPLPGDYQVLDAGGHVAVCALTSESLIAPVAAAESPHVAVVGTLYTENLGIERIVTNVLANPILTTLVVCGADSEQRIGHRPGQTLLSLMEHGVDEKGRIRQAQGRRPVLRNLSLETVERFRREITLVDRLGEQDPDTVLEVLASVPPPDGPRPASTTDDSGPDITPAEAPPRLVLDPQGYFIVFPDRSRQAVLVEHYTNEGTLADIFTGSSAHELYATIIARDLVSRLDHAAYLGMELARAERALETGEPYVQDQAPEPPCDAGCGCTPRIGTEGNAGCP